MIIKEAEAGLILRHVIVSELSIFNELAGSGSGNFDENNQLLDMDYDILDLKSSDKFYSAEVKLKTKITIKKNKKKYFDMKISHIGFLIAPKEAYDDEENFYKAVEINGLASLISFARANIASITGMIFCQGNIMLPMINVFKLNKLKEENKNK